MPSLEIPNRISPLKAAQIVRAQAVWREATEATKKAALAYARQVGWVNNLAQHLMRFPEDNEKRAEHDEQVKKIAPLVAAVERARREEDAALGAFQRSYLNGPGG
jgi:hypothetical protein